MDYKSFAIEFVGIFALIGAHLTTIEKSLVEKGLIMGGVYATLWIAARKFHNKGMFHPLLTFAEYMRLQDKTEGHVVAILIVQFLGMYAACKYFLDKQNLQTV